MASKAKNIFSPEKRQEREEESPEKSYITGILQTGATEVALSPYVGGLVGDSWNFFEPRQASFTLLIRLGKSTQPFIYSSSSKHLNSALELKDLIIDGNPELRHIAVVPIAAKLSVERLNHFSRASISFYRRCGKTQIISRLRPPA